MFDKPSCYFTTQQWQGTWRDGNLLQKALVTSFLSLALWLSKFWAKDYHKTQTRTNDQRDETMFIFRFRPYLSRFLPNIASVAAQLNKSLCNGQVHTVDGQANDETTAFNMLKERSAKPLGSFSHACKRRAPLKQRLARGRLAASFGKSHLTYQSTSAIMGSGLQMTLRAFLALQKEDVSQRYPQSYCSGPAHREFVLPSVLIKTH